MFILKKNISVYKMLLFFITTFLLLVVIPNYYVDVYLLKELSKPSPNSLFNLPFDNTEYEHSPSPLLIVFLNSLEYKVSVLITLIITILFTIFTLIKKETSKNTNIVNKVFKLCLMFVLLFFFYCLIYISYDFFIMTDNLEEFETLLKD